MAVRVRRGSILAAVLAAAAVVVSAGSASSGSAGSSSAAAPSPTLYVLYSMDCTFTIVDDAGKNVSSIAPGAYQVEVRTPMPFGTVNLGGVTDLTACRGFPQFQLTGPGVNLSTTMTVGCESDKVFPETFQPNATYTAQDNNQPSVARGSFTTLASGSPTKPVSSYSGTASGKPVLSTDLVGSGILPLRGTLTGTLSAAGKPTLTMKGKTVSTLKVGRYTFAITDRNAKGSFNILGPKMKSTAKLTGVKFVGKHSATITLQPGRWTYYASLGNIHYFVVTR